jgi:nitrous oxide reductase accessory protein NosL
MLDMRLYAPAEPVTDGPWLPAAILRQKQIALHFNRKNEDIGASMRIYVPDMEKTGTWTAPKAEMLR